MSVSTNQGTDTSTENANWGTLVILLVLAFTAVTIGVILYSDSRKPAVPITVTAPASATAPAVQAAPGPDAPASPVSTPPTGSPTNTGAATGSPAAGASGGQ